MVAQFGFRFSSRRDIYDETGIYAAWYFAQRLEEECSRASRSGEHFAVVCLSVDSRSALTAGCQLRLHVRDYDLIGRVGKERFAVAVLGAGPDAAEAVADRLRETLPIGSDLGFAWFPEDGKTPEQLVLAATKRMLGGAIETLHARLKAS